MSRVVVGVGASHTTLMNTKWAEVDHLDRAHAYRDALGEARATIEASGADVAVVIGPNHFRGFWLDLIPMFTIAVGEVTAAGEHGTPEGPQPTDCELARALLGSLLDDGFDIAFSARLQVDHGISHAIQYVLPAGMPVVPLVVNCFAAPLPSLRRCAALGDAIAVALASDGLDRHVAVIGSGGLSHDLPFPDWRSPESDDDAYLVESWMNGRSSWADYEVRRRQIVTAALPRVNEPFDTDVLSRVGGGSLRSLVDLDDDPANLANLAGNGAAELRNWLVMAGACGWAAGRTLAYSAMPEWLTGMGVAVIDSPATPRSAS